MGRNAAENRTRETDKLVAAKELLRTTLRRLGYQVTRVRPPNRFEGMKETLTLLRNAGYMPRVVIDAGANCGSWAQMARAIFPGAAFHLVEPQPACADLLRKQAARSTGMTVHRVAVTKPGVKSVRVVGGGATGDGTGARVAKEDETDFDEMECPATTLDDLLADEIGPDSRCLCKLDLERHELEALQGAAQLLLKVEVILSEVSFYDINNRGDAIFSDMLRFLGERNFELYDVACLGARPRDMRLKMGDVVFVRRDSRLMEDNAWK